MPAIRPARADGVNDIFRFQIKTRRDHGGAGITMPDPAAGCLKPVMSRRFEDRAADTAAGPQAFIGRIDDRVRIQVRDADLFDLDSAHRIASESVSFPSEGPGVLSVHGRYRDLPPRHPHS